MEQKLLYYVVPNESFKAEGRVFFKGEKYPVYENDNFSILCAENGSFNFSDELMKQAVTEWGLDIIPTLKVVK